MFVDDTGLTVVGAPAVAGESERSLSLVPSRWAPAASMTMMGRGGDHGETVLLSTAVAFSSASRSNESTSRNSGQFDALVCVHARLAYSACLYVGIAILQIASVRDRQACMIVGKTHLSVDAIARPPVEAAR